ncbi:hypothetical protein E2542_SST28012 [Spatholobus suberectus]|nr:hypothetical protein E2542_SST28012 [Spatholobus suberectus]
MPPSAGADEGALEDGEGFHEGLGLWAGPGCGPEPFWGLGRVRGGGGGEGEGVGVEGEVGEERGEVGEGC